jgi:tyrosyl-tRNA synthetase
VGKHITVNYMMAKDSVRKRIEGETGISYTEFAYQLMQGYDFYWLYTELGCKLQMGGSDQWGNITTGTELIRRKAGGEAFAFTCPLITKSDGGKFGKTEQGNVWLDPARTSPYQFYQFWLNTTDADAARYIRIFTFLDQPAILAMEKEHLQAPEKRLLQKKLAEEVTRFVHGPEALQEAQQTTAQLFSNQDKPVEEMSEQDLINLQGIVRCEISRQSFEGNGSDIISLLAGSGIMSSRGEARKMILNGGIQVNRRKVSDPQQTVSKDQLLHTKFLLVQKGKKNYFLVEAVD